MGNVLQLVIRYGGVIARYGAYLKYLPFVYQLVMFIRQAEASFRAADSGPDKLAWAVQQFTSLVDSAESSGLIQAKLAKALREGAANLITAIVEAMKEAGGVPPLDPDAPLPDLGPVA